MFSLWYMVISAILAGLFTCCIADELPRNTLFLSLDGAKYLKLTVPPGFKLDSSTSFSSPAAIRQQYFPAGENVHNWHQLITITAFHIKSSPTPEAFVAHVAQDMKSMCGGNFSYMVFGNGEFYQNTSGFAGVISCGLIMDQAHQSVFSESELVILLKSQDDYFQLTWSEKGSAQSLPANQGKDGTKWSERIYAFSPINVCDKNDEKCH